MPPDSNREIFIQDMRAKNSNTGGFMENCKALLHDNAVSHFFVHQRNNNVYALSKELKEVPKKVVIFMNVPPGKLTEENIPNLVFQEVGGNALQFLYNLSNEVFMPILQNPSYQAGWSDLICKDLMEKLNNFNATMYLTLGQLGGKTLLPLPQKKIIESTAMNDKDKADIFNNSIITWMKQIRKVLDTEPEQNLKGGNNPGPEIEIEFWQKKAENLNSIHEQLESNEVALILKMIRDSKSTYATEFEKQKQAIKKARDEANDNYMYLRTLSEYFKELNDQGKEFTKLHELFMPIMKVILLIWERSEYYNKPARLVVLIREICNAIINKANYFVSGPAIISMIKSKEEVSKACSDLQTTIDICTKFKECFFEFKKLSKANGSGGWALPTNALFIRLDSFLERCHDIMHISETILQFNKLEDIQIGGTKGKNLTATVKQIFEQFNKAVQDFHSPESAHASKEGAEGEEAGGLDEEYDIMDISKKQFDEHFFQFRNRIKELERRLAAVITQSFDDLDTLTDKFRLLDSFDELLKRPIIQDELEKKHIVLIETYKKDLKTVQEIFVTFSRPPAPGDKEKKMDEQALYKNLPPYAGTLSWTRSLKGRINAPLEKLEQISPDIKEKEEFKDVEKMKKVIEGRLNEDESQNLLNWQRQDGENAEQKLDQFLLVRDETNMTLRVNFDPSLVSLLREVKYLKNIEGIKIPEPAERVYSKSETYRKQVNKLDQIVEKYNFIVTKLEVVEEPLITNKIEKLNEALRPGIEDLKWKSPDIDTFINSVMKNVNEVYEIVEAMKSDLEFIREKLGQLNSDNKMIVERKNKSVAPEDFLNEHNGYHAHQQGVIKSVSNMISRKIKDITDKIIGPGSNASSANFKKSKEYKDYLEFINDIVIDGLSRAICTSLTGLNNMVKIGSAVVRPIDYQPMFDVRLDIKDDRIQYEPSISNPSDPRSIRSILQKIVDDYISYASLSCISRIDTGAGDYINEMHDNFEIRHMMAAINENLNMICSVTDKFTAQYDRFKKFWTEKPQVAFDEFKKKELTPEQQQRAADESQETIDPDKSNPVMEGVTPQMYIPPLKSFKDKIEELKKEKKEVLILETQHNIEWLKINTNPLKNSLESRVDIWINMYTNFLLTQVKTFLKNCEEFKKYLIEGTSKDPSEHAEDTALLKKVMEVLAKERVVALRIGPNIDYIKKLITILKDNDVEMKMDPSKASDGKGDDFAAMVEDIFVSFNEISQRKVLTMKNSILPLKQKETLVLKDSINKFSAEISQFRSEFLEKAPFDYNKFMSLHDIDACYDKLDAYYTQLEDFRARAKHFNQLEILFELEPTKYKQILDCQNDIERMKRMWDTISMIRYTYESWLKVPWKKLNIAEYSEENLKYVNIVLKGLPREIKLFKGFPAITTEVENMKKTIECLGILSGGKLEKRHWAALATAIKSGPIEENSPSFCFESMVKLRIYEFVKEVTELEETAQKESTTGKILGELMKKWKERAFQFENFVLLQEELKIFKQFDEIQNELSADNLRVLGFIAQGKSVEIFKNDIDELKVRLGNIDECLVVWEKVQKNWKRLVNIFMLSDDIRNQLPEATKLFETKNNEFKGIMAEAYSNPILYDICRPEKREELEGILKAIESCEKQLNQYLEQKKKIFPRFYFVSNQTLIDILSNGNNPQKIATEYLGDLFDGLKKLILAKPKEGDLTMKAEAMWSKDDEEVKFKTPFEPTEAVEVWLNKLEYKMRETLENYLIQAKREADGLMRNQAVEWDGRLAWLFNYCAQISLLVVQTIWTEDVHQAFDDIEGGQSNAMKECLKVIKQRISTLIAMVRGKLTPGDRNKIITIITIDVHSRDAVEKLSNQGINDKENFQWSSQLKFFLSTDITDIVAKGQRLRFEWETNKDREKAIIRIVDWTRFYSYEYIGNCGRLVITPLTDRCYITLTQALGLCMGGAPAGPAGTGKTETTKDLGRAIGLAVFVFNCSEQMSTDSLGQNFMGLSQTGAWGCFDEFNRISIEVLSVVSTQVKSIQDALRVMLRNKDSKDDKFMFMDDEISLADTVGLFITMNPGYAGRTELPESLKALFRSCAMVVPDLVLICENMLMSEGYEEAKELAKKFVTLYVLSRSLLSKQKHYDWGLRAVKSVLRQAGKLKRDPANASFGEKRLLMRALRDFNMPKIYIEDKSIFINLLKDLFKGEEDPPVLIDEKLERAVAQVAEGLNLIPDSVFCTKCVQLSEILEVRHCVFVIGPPGCGKSKVWSTLLETYKRNGADTEKDCLDPKAVTSDELFGVLTKSKEFKNGVLSSIIRNQSKEYGKYKAVHKHKWAVLDGDIDPEWIESLNTVMDDNKVLTLVSNDRFPITPTMRLVFEISNLRNATPATVSRAGVIYINDTDIGWKPFLDSWLHSHRAENIESKRNKSKDNVISRKAVFDLKAESVFMKCFSQLEKSEVMKLNRICPVVEIQLVQTTCALIDELVLENYNTIQLLKDENEQKAAYEGIFYYASMWGYGGAIAIDPNDDKKSYSEFDKTWRQRAKIPEVAIEGLGSTKYKPIYDFQFNVSIQQWEQIQAEDYEIQEDINFLRIFVPTVGTQRLTRLIQLHVLAKKPILFVGNAGTGKTTVINQYLSAQQKSDQVVTYNTNFSSKTSSASLQENIMNSGIEKLGTRFYGLSNKTLVFFIDDMNMPYVDKYGTQSPIALLRQIIDYGIVYDRDNLEEYITLKDLYFCGCMNPKAGSFTIEPRLQRHFSVFAVQTPDETIIKQIYTKILGTHFEKFRFTPNVDVPTKMVDATFLLFKTILEKGKNFSPTAQKFHYQFNLREISRVTEGVMMGTITNYNDKLIDVFKLWVHETRRVFEDRLIQKDDITMFRQLQMNAYNLMAADTPLVKDAQKEEVFSEHNIFTSFISVWEVMDDKFYLPAKSQEQLSKCLNEKLAEYNESNSQMNLVLFFEAVQHICRIARIIERPAGNALLVGVGGSGKQSLTKLAVFLHSQELDIIKSTGFNIADFKTSLINIFKKVTKPPGVAKCLVATDAQLANENILIYLNEILNSGYISGIWEPKVEFDAHLNSLKNEVKNSGFNGTNYQYFIEKIRKNLHVCLCMSPVGDTLRVRARKFPGIVNQCQIDWFHSWPQQALYDVAYSFLKDLPLPERAEKMEIDIRQLLAEAMSETHIGIDETNKDFLAKERRYNYTTPKSFLELIDFYKSSFAKTNDKIEKQIISLQKSLIVLKETNEKVNNLKEVLKVISAEVEVKSRETEKLLAIVNADKADAEEEQRKADIESEKTNKVKQEAETIAAEALTKFMQAKPMQEKAEKSIENLSDAMIGEMGKFAKPPVLVVLVGRALLYLLSRKKGIDLYKEAQPEKDWPDVQKMMKEPKRFLNDLKAFAQGAAKELDLKFKDYLRPLLAQAEFQVKEFAKISIAGQNLCDFIHNIIGFSDAYQIVAPLEAKSKDAKARRDAAIAELNAVLAKVAEIKAKVDKLEIKLAEAQEEKRLVEEKRNYNLIKMQNAEDLVNGLSSNQIRWVQTENRLQLETMTAIGESLLASQFVSYIGPFSAPFRVKLWRDNWLPKIKDKKIPITEGIDPLRILTNSDGIARWKNEGLPEDQMSVENAAIITSSNRWPLIIDPQLQGGSWITGHVATNEMFKRTTKIETPDGKEEYQTANEQLLRISLNADKWDLKLEEAIQAGRVVMLENVTQDIDPMLDPLLSRAFIYKKGNSNQAYIMFNREEPTYYHRDFRLYLQCKISNPHFKPETAAQCSIINFIVTESGLEDQLLAVVVDVEKPELERKKTDIMRKMNENAVKLVELDNQLLLGLAKANPDTILDDIELIATLNNTKSASKEIEVATAASKITEKEINEERNNYRPVAAEGAMLYFLIISLNAVNHMYQYSLESFHTFFDKGIHATPKELSGKERIQRMVLVIRETIYEWIARGLFEKHKILFLSMMTFRLMTKGQLKIDYTDKELRFLLTCIPKFGIDNPVKDWLKGTAWNNALRLAELNGFEKLPESMGNELASRFKEWYSQQNPENENLPPSWKFVNQNPFKRLLVLRALRPDRMIPALSNFIREALPEGQKFVGMDQNNSFADILRSAYKNATQEGQLNTPIFFILSTGADPVREVEKLGEQEGFSTSKNNFFNISLGQGQDVIANAKLDISYKEGCWIMLQNIHLMPSWLPTFEKILDRYSKEGGASDRFRLFLSAEPSNDIPISILEKCIKLTNEPPTGLKANMKRAWTYFNPAEISEKESRIKGVLFALCYFHSVLIERRKFGPKGWNMFYPFNIGDLRDSARVLENNVEPGAGRLPWADFKYIFGEIMYGGHIVDDWDRRLCAAYLEGLMVNDLQNEEFELLPFVTDKPSLKTPPLNGDHEKFKERIDSALTDKETPVYYGLHPNAEINLGTTQCNTLFETLMMLQPQDVVAKKVEAGDGDADGGSKDNPYIVKVQSDWVLAEKMFNLEDIKDKVSENKGPYQNVFLQECEYMNYLIEEICSSLGQLKKAKDGELTYSEKLEKLENNLNLEKVPEGWADLAYPAKRSLTTWFENLLRRIEQLSAWKDEPTTIPKVTKINLLFNPQSFLTAIKQESRKDDLNKLTISTDFTKKTLEQIDVAAKDGAYCHGFLLDGASWDTPLGLLDEAKPKEMYSHMPVCLCRSVKINDSEREDKSVYQCPVYRTEMRGATFIFTAQLKTPPKFDPRKWVLAGVAIILDVEGESDLIKTEKEEKK